MRQLLLLTSIIMFFIFTSCAGSSNAQNSRHRKPVSTGRNKCGCSLLIPSNSDSIKSYHHSIYALQA